MAEQTGSDLAGDLLRIHAIITRGLAVAAAGNPLDEVTRLGYVSYTQTLARVLRAHHLTEDEMAFPYFRQIFPDPPYDMLTAQHGALGPLLDATEAALAELAGGTHPEAARDALQAALAAITDLWHPHIAVEQSHFTSEKMAVLLDPEEQGRLSRTFAEHSQQRTTPDYLVAPFLLYNLSAADRAILARQMPPIVTEQLVPIVWREQWEHMRPFLLP